MNCGPAVEAPFRESKDEEMRPNEAARMKAMEKIFKNGYREMKEQASNQEWGAY